MEEQIREELCRYKNLSMKLIEELRKDNYAALDNVLLERQKIIDWFILIDYSKEKFQSIMDQLGIQKLDLEIKTLMTNKRDEVKGMINKLSDQRNAHKSYNSKFSVDSIYFNKKL